MLFFGKENVFTCLVAFQNIFRKIFFGVWKRTWKRRRKRQNPEKPGQTQKNTARSPRSTARSRIAINGAISRSCQLRLARTVLRARSRGAISRSFSLSFSLCASSLCVSPVPEIIWSENRNINEFSWSTLLFYGQLKMISGKFNFPNQPNSLFYGKWFLETLFIQNKHSLKL